MYKSTTSTWTKNTLIGRGSATGLMLLLLTSLLLAGVAQAAGKGGFDHFSTGFPLDGGHENADCDSCHARGVFKGTPRRCAACHATTSRLGGERLPPGHIATNSICEDCHSTFSWTQIARFDHNSVVGTCSSCHNGNTEL